MVLFRRKGTPIHKALGRLWVVLMLVTATSAIFINEIRLIGPFSPIHLFVVFTYAGIAQGVWHIRRGEVARHRADMVGLYFGALGLAGAFTLLPGRRMNEVLFGPDAGIAPAIAAIAVVIAATIWFWRRAGRSRRTAKRAAA